MCNCVRVRIFQQLFLTFIGLLFCFPLYAADLEIPVTPGAKDQTITIAFENPTIREIQNLHIRIRSLPPWVEQAKLSTNLVQQLDIAESVNVSLNFDVKSTATDSDSGEIELSFELEKEQGELDTYLVTIGPSLLPPPSSSIVQESTNCPIDKERSSGNWTGPEQHYVFTFYDIQSSKLLRILILTSHADGFVEIAKQSPKDHRYGPFATMAKAEAQANSLCGVKEPNAIVGLPVFMLAEISSPSSSKYGIWEHEYDGKSTGYVERWTHKRKKHITEQATVITQYPKRIVLGKPFSYTVKGVRRVDNNKFCVNRDKKHDMNVVSIGLRTSISTVDIAGEKNLHAYCDEAGVFINVRGKQVRKTTRSLSKADEISATLTMVPTKVVRDKQGRPIEFFYQPQVSGNGKVNTYGGLQERRFYALGGRKVEALGPDGFFKHTDFMDSVSVGMIDLRLRYKPATHSSQPLDPPAFAMPEHLEEFSSSLEPSEMASSENDQEIPSVNSADRTTNQDGISDVARSGVPSTGESSGVQRASGDDSVQTFEEEGLPSHDQTVSPSIGDEQVVGQGPYPTSGPYTTTEGEMTFLESGPLAARYHQDGGRLVGRFDGLVFTGVWVEKQSGQKCGTQQDGSAFWGKVQFTFKENFDVFKGVWGYCEDVPTQKWDGHRKEESTTREPNADSSSSTNREQEPNNSLETAQSVPLPTNLQGFIDPKRDADWYRVELPAQGALEVAITNMPKEVNVTFRVWGANKKVVHGWQTAKNVGEDHVRVVDLAAPGTYYLELRDSTDNARSAQPYTLRTRLTPTKDTGEPNNTLATATPLKLGQAIQANILPKRDADWYRVELPAQGGVRGGHYEYAERGQCDLPGVGGEQEGGAWVADGQERGRGPCAGGGLGRAGHLLPGTAG